MSANNLAARWSETNSPLSPGSKEGRLSRESSLKTRGSNAFSKTGTWTFEIISLLVATGAVAGIIGVLGYFDGHALPDWPLGITLSALIALLATVANANLAATLQSGISQLKWIRFKAGRAPLSDMEAFDEASRGVWGSMKLLVLARGGVFGSFGAILSILALALGPFAQQMATFRSHMVASADAAALVPRALNYTGYLPGRSSSNGFVPILPMKSAVYAGLFAENNNPNAPLNVTCATGNCTYEPFETLAVCNSCIDMTPYLTSYCADGEPADGNRTTCGWQLPNSTARLNSSTDVFSMTSSFPSAFGDMPYATIMRLTFIGTEAWNVPNVTSPWAQQCTLSACIQTISSNVVNGDLSETVTSTANNNTVLDISSGQDTPVYLTSTATNETFLLAMGAKLAFEAWFAGVFKTGSASRSAEATNTTVSEGNVIVNLTVGVSSGNTFFDTDVVTAFYWNYYEYSAGLPMLMHDLATSMTVAMRSFMGAVPHEGTAWRYESFVEVRWAFVAVPALIVFATALFLFAAIWRSKVSGTKLWKSSALAMLLHGLDQGTREKVGLAGSLVEKKRRARDVKVQLDGNGDAGSLLRE
ncbi:hypothetical protein K431DRAFT_321182 [Polychaeton citri CBS 116435]|uniref:DUF3176 domain-containing protein n=1 Tax=Polychaeton citri CBS 116435 TaxID=1314669 RepID=A0A9P4UPC2_9PEZI|nr:hypothetical protein K431DRAFT_321182 [Polychaeton citri CBS 116435]